MSKHIKEYNYCVQFFEKDGTTMYMYVMAPHEEGAKKKANKKLKPFRLKAVNATKVR
jgi:hypothetical protein